MSATLTEIAATLEQLSARVGFVQLTEEVGSDRTTVAIVLRRRAEQVGDQICVYCGCGELAPCEDDEASACAWHKPRVCTHYARQAGHSPWPAQPSSDWPHGFEVKDAGNGEWLLSAGEHARDGRGAVFKIDLDGDTKFAWSTALPIRVVAESFDDALAAAWVKFFELLGPVA